MINKPWDKLELWSKPGETKLLINRLPLTLLSSELACRYISLISKYHVIFILCACMHPTSAMPFNWALISLRLAKHVPFPLSYRYLQISPARYMCNFCYSQPQNYSSSVSQLSFTSLHCKSIDHTLYNGKVGYADSRSLALCHGCRRAVDSVFRQWNARVFAGIPSTAFNPIFWLMMGSCFPAALFVECPCYARIGCTEKWSCTKLHGPIYGVRFLWDMSRSVQVPCVLVQVFKKASWLWIKGWLKDATFARELSS